MKIRITILNPNRANVASTVNSIATMKKNTYNKLNILIKD